MERKQQQQIESLTAELMTSITEYAHKLDTYCRCDELKCEAAQRQKEEQVELDELRQRCLCLEADVAEFVSPDL